MCDRCTKHSKYWIHIADDWTDAEKAEMIEYLTSGKRTSIHKEMQDKNVHDLTKMNLIKV